MLYESSSVNRIWIVSAEENFENVRKVIRENNVRKYRIFLATRWEIKLGCGLR